MKFSFYLLSNSCVCRCFFPQAIILDGAFNPLMRMNRKVIFVGVILFLLCFSIIGNACAQASVGVAEGDTFTYDFSAYFRSDNASAPIPMQLVLDNETQWLRFTITGVVNLTVSYSVLQHLVNGTEATSESYADLATGEGGFPIIASNLGYNATLYPSYTSVSPIVNETLNRTYQGVQRTINHVSSNDTQTDSYIDAYFDQTTGMPVELHVTFAASADGNAEYVYELIDSNIWTIPEFPTTLMLTLIAISTLAGALIYKKTLKQHTATKDS
jgi:hypothetical protein